MTCSCATASHSHGHLVLVCGLPGVGKTTLSRQLASQLHAFRMCPDETMLKRGIDLRDEQARARIETRQWLLTRRLLVRGCTVILEFGFWGQAERDEKRQIARDIGAHVDLYYLSASLEELCRRLAIRQTALGWAPISLDQMARWANMFEAPTAAEVGLFDSCATFTYPAV